MSAIVVLREVLFNLSRVVLNLLRRQERDEKATL